MTSRCLVFCFHCFGARSGDQEMILARNIDYRSILQKPLKHFQIVERGRKIHEEKKNEGRLKGGKGTPVNIPLQSSFRP